MSKVFKNGSLIFPHLIYYTCSWEASKLLLIVIHFQNSLHAPIFSGSFGEINEKIGHMTDRVFVQFLQIIRTSYPINNTSIAFPGVLECDISWFKDYNSSDLRYWWYQVTIELSAFQDVNWCSTKSDFLFLLDTCSLIYFLLNLVSSSYPIYYILSFLYLTASTST